MKKIFGVAIALALLCGVPLGAQVYTAAYANLENAPAVVDVAPADINPGEQQSLSFADEAWSGGITTSITGPAYSAGLSKRVVALPANVHQFTLIYQIRPSQAAALYAQVYETDLIIVDAAGNRYNGSCQINNYEGGMWQIANAAGGWVDTGFKPGLLPPDVWTQVAVVYQVNWQALTISVVSIEDGGQVFSGLSPPLENVPAAQKSGWQPSILDVQIQDGLDSEAGSYTRDMRNIGILMQ